MTTTEQGGSLARTHRGEPGLPRGRAKLPADEVRAAQRERLVRAIVAATAEAGYPKVTVADVVARAKVSRAAFYAHFTDKEDCFFAASLEGRRLMVESITGQTRALPADTPAERALRVACRAFLGFLAREPEFARLFYIDLLSAGPRAVARLEEAQEQFARLNEVWHQRARREHPEWPQVPRTAYRAVVGATTELVRSVVHNGQTASLPDMEDTLVTLYLAVLAGQRWTA
ncbi:MAG TPA: TetR/AcrR family transcriptional regulator [Pseudonocardiaceae bacterium]|nr:TetR/AcrR family transcriptional regulator [Pseudonocardiaceae bacterium]